MSPIVIALTASLFLELSLCVLILSLGKKSFLAWMFLVFNALLINWDASFIAITVTGSEAAREAWYLASLVSSYLIPATAILIGYNIKTRRVPAKRTISLVYLPGTLFFLAALVASSPGFFTTAQGSAFRIYERTSSISSILNVIVTVTHIPVVILLLIQTARLSPYRRSKKQARAIIAASIAGIGATVAVYLFDTAGTSPLRYIPSNLMYVFVSWLCIFRYRLIVDSPSFSMDRLWDFVDQALILTDENGFMVSWNRKAGERLPGRIDKGIALSSLFTELTVIEGQKRQLMRIAPPGKSDGTIGELVYVSIEPVKDQYKDTLGYMAVLNSSLPYTYMKERFGITHKEWEVFSLLATGAEYREIGEKLFISPFTVKNHVHNIYEKTNIKNRYELISLIFPF